MIPDKARKFLGLRKSEEPEYMMRTCDSRGVAYGGFRWPKRGGVTCPDWTADPGCGNGLHGLLRGGGDGELLSDAGSALWYVVAINPREVIDLDGKIKVPRGWVLKCGDCDGVTAWFSKRYQGVCYGKATAGNYGTATAGYGGYATAGDYGTATAGNYGGYATAGNHGTAMAGDYGTAMAGDYGKATAGNYGTATAGDHGIIRIDWYHGMRMRTVVGYVGEDGIEPNVAYRVVSGKLVKL